MDSLRLFLLLGAFTYGAVAIDNSRELIRAHRASIRAELTYEDSLYIKQVNGLATVQPVSILVQDKMLLGTGLDRQDLLLDPTAHAETEAIRDACRRVKKSVLTGGVLYASRQPCTMCMHVVAQAGLVKVVVTGSGEHSPRLIPVPEIIQ